MIFNCETINEAIRKIYTWDKGDVAFIKSYINDIEYLINEQNYPLKLDQLIDMPNLPTNYIPDMLTLYPIWCMDNYGRCLTGDDMQDIERIEDIISRHYY